MRAASALALLAALAAAALLAEKVWTVALITAVLLVVCMRAPRRQRRLYILGTAISALAVFFFTPFVATMGSHVIWSGPLVPVLGQLDVTHEELTSGALNAFRLAAVGLAFAAYALLLDHDRLLQAARFARPAALATRMMPTLERDAVGLVEALRGRGVEVTGVRGRARLLSPLLAGSLERALSLAEAMEARGFGGSSRTAIPRPPWRAIDYAALVLALAVVSSGALWL